MLDIIGDLQLERVPVQGALRDAITKFSYELSMQEVSQLEMTLIDPGLKHWSSRRLMRGAEFRWRDLVFVVAAATIGGEKFETVMLECRPIGVQRLRQRTGARVWTGKSATKWLAEECAAVGLKFVGQPTTTRSQIVRESEAGKPPESSWDVARRMAGEEGFELFEHAGTLYFGAPSWFALERVESKIEVWRWPSLETPLIAIPKARVSEDAQRGTQIFPATIDGVVPIEVAMRYRPGQAIKVELVGFNGRYLVTSIKVDADKEEAKVTIDSPIDPDPHAQSTTSGSGLTGASPLSFGSKLPDNAIAALAYNALLKFGVRPTVEMLTIAVAVGLGESLGDPGVHNGEGKDDSWGIWQLNVYGGIHGEVKTGYERAFGVTLANWPHDLSDPAVNAYGMALISGGGKTWRPWSAFTNGRYLQFINRAQTAAKAVMQSARNLDGTVEVDISPVDYGGSAGTSDRFVQAALAQDGDLYHLGSQPAVATADPDVFDCSGLVRWALGQAGVTKGVPSTARSQFDWSRKITVEQAFGIRGALLFRINTATKGTTGHVAISLGDGRTIEAMNSQYGVRIGSTAGRFDHAGLAPGLDYG